MRRGWLTFLTSLALVTLFVGSPCRALLSPANASPHSCCEKNKESDSTTTDSGCQSRCAALKTLEVTVNPAWQVDGNLAVLPVVLTPALAPVPPVSFSHFHSPPASNTPLYLNHSSLLI
jgi:hypothetical protein